MQVEALQELALRISGERNVHTVHQHIVAGLVQQSGVALARVWVVKPGDICQSCRMRPSCPDQTRCLHLAASAGSSLTKSWSRKDGDSQANAAWPPQGWFGGVRPHRLADRGSTLRGMGAP